MSALRHLTHALCLILTVTAPAQIVNCSSNDMGRHSCPANTSNGVRLQRQISGSPCVAGQTWGYENSFIWVDRGCRADFALNVGAMPQGSSQASSVDTMRACKNAVSTRRPNVPLAYILVDEPRPNGGSMLSVFRVQPPNGAWSAGTCDVFRNGRVNVNFTSTGGGNNNGYGNGGGYGGSASSPQTAQRLCKDAASAHLPNVLLAYISTYRGTDTGDGKYMINFHAQPPGGRNSSGFCIISKGGQLERFEFDPGSGNSYGGSGNNGNNNSGADPHNATLLCKNGISSQWPNVPLAYIDVNLPRVTGGSLTSTFRVQPPGRPSSSGTCEVFKNGKTNIQYNR
jgi:hypothetical protein